MSNISHEPPLSTPPCATISMEKTRWFENEVHVHNVHLESYIRGSFPSVDAEDIVQESLLRTWLANAARPIGSAKAFLFTVARHLAIDSIRRQKKSPITAMSDLAVLDVMDDGRNPVEAAAVSDEIALLADAIDSLPPQCREIILLRKLQGLPQREVAALLSTTEAAVGQQVCRGILRLVTFFASRGAIETKQNKP